MPSIALTGKDTIKINDRILNDQADGDVANLTFPSDISTIKTGKNGNSIYSFNNTGRQAEVTIRVLRGSADDKYLNGLLALQKNEPSTFVLMAGEFTKHIGDGAGNLTTDTYIMQGGIFKKQVEVKENADGDVEQAVSVYTLAFANAPRTIS